MLLLLKLNNIKVNYSQGELVKLGLEIAEGSYEIEEIRDWIKNHMI